VVWWTGEQVLCADPVGGRPSGSAHHIPPVLVVFEVGKAVKGGQEAVKVFKTFKIRQIPDSK
jgi:hypothetical protein